MINIYNNSLYILYTFLFLIIETHHATSHTYNKHNYFSRYLHFLSQLHEYTSKQKKKKQKKTNKPLPPAILH